MKQQKYFSPSHAKNRNSVLVEFRLRWKEVCCFFKILL